MAEGLEAGEAEAQGAFFLNPVHRLNAAAEGLGHVAAAEKGEPDDAAGFRIGFNTDLRQAVVNEEQLHQQGRVPAQFHISCGNLPEYRYLPVERGCAEQTDQRGEEDARCACPQGQPCGFPVERQHAFDIRPIHCAVFLSFRSGRAGFMKNPGSRLQAPGQL